MGLACHLIDKVTAAQVAVLEDLNFVVWEAKKILWVYIFVAYSQI